MEEEKQVIEALFNIGVQKETTLEIIHEVLFNATKYVDNQENLDVMLQEKLGIDLYKKINKKK